MKNVEKIVLPRPTRHPLHGELKARKIPHSSVAKYLGCSVGYLKMMLSGREVPTLEWKARLDKALADVLDGILVVEP